MRNLHLRQALPVSVNVRRLCRRALLLREGVDFYANGQNYAMASLLTLAGPTLLGQSAFDNLLLAFQNAVKEKTPAATSTLITTARTTQWRQLPEALGPLAQFAAPECLSAISNPGVDTDAALVVLQSLISRMEVMADAVYCVEHDQSIKRR